MLGAAYLPPLTESGPKKRPRVARRPDSTVLPPGPGSGKVPLGKTPKRIRFSFHVTSETGDSHNGKIKIVALAGAFDSSQTKEYQGWGVRRSAFALIRRLHSASHFTPRGGRADLRTGDHPRARTTRLSTQSGDALPDSARLGGTRLPSFVRAENWPVGASALPRNARWQTRVGRGEGETARACRRIDGTGAARSPVAANNVSACGEDHLRYRSRSRHLAFNVRWALDE